MLHEEHGKLFATNTELAGQVSTLKAELESKTAEIGQLGEQKATLAVDILALSERKKGLAEDVSTFDVHVAKKKLESSDLEASAAQRLEGIEAAITTLEVKERDLSTRMVKSREEDDKVRASLALWQRKLEDQDKNLRIREARVTQQEESITRNHNLLNL